MITPQFPERLDVALVARGLAPSREKAKAAISAGLVFVNGKPATKPSTPVPPGVSVEVRGVALRYVGRGGLKLERALDAFALDVTGARCVDLGASTGGFTDCLLQRGASHVWAVDVGHDQLDARLASDGRVTSLEGTDARIVTPDMLGGPVDVAVTDVSFISLSKVLPAMAALLREGGAAVCLIKPQFEAGREHVGKRGVVRDPAVHCAVIERVLGEARATGLEPRGLDYSPITGPEGNIEYLMHAVRRTDDVPLGDVALNVSGVVSQAHAAFGR
ncbi:MAG: TlyA family RNA methyltransferase [Coriobacteriia bacterium]|nr:TlyA family RNA methyltransferase [Coriobacteriia bacterium]MBS5478237.1 TlyA family RNA methyltransferase [Coriobacteriia bacterium]